MWSIIELKKMLSLQQDSIGWFLAVIAVWGISLRPLLYLACMARQAVLEDSIISMMCVQQKIATINATPLPQCMLASRFIGTQKSSRGNICTEIT